MEVNHFRIINDNNNAKPSGFIFYAEAITYLKIFNLQDFTFKTCKQSFGSSFSLCVTVNLNEPIEKPWDVTKNEFFYIFLSSLA